MTAISHQQGKMDSVHQRCDAFIDARPALAKAADWDVRKPIKAVIDHPQGRWIALGVFVALTAIVVTLAATGVLPDWYEWFWKNTEFWTDNKRPFTHIMRDNPLVYLLLAIIGVGSPPVLLPRGAWTWGFAAYTTFLAGFLGGHVFW